MINDETPIKPETPAPSEPAVHSSDRVRRRQLRSIAKIVRDCMGWMNGWSATPEAEQKSAMKAAKRIHAMTSKWKSPNEKGQR